MKRSTIQALMEGHKQRLNEGLIFWKATNDLDRAGDEYVYEVYDTDIYKFGDGDINFKLETGDRPEPYTEWYKGNDVVVGFSVSKSHKEFVESFTDYDVQRIVRPLIAKAVAKTTGQYVMDYQIDCKLTALYVEKKLTWEEYCKTIVGSC